MEKGLTVVSWGIGQDSTAILAKIINDSEFRNKYVRGKLIVVTANTKNEHDNTYHYLEYYKNILQENNISFYLLDPSKYASSSWSGGLIEFYKSKNAVGSKAFPKTCTDHLKIRPIYKFLEYYIHKIYETKSYGRKSAFYEFQKDHGKVRVLLGIAKGEEKRASQNGDSPFQWFNECIEKVYPLIELGLNRQNCQDYISKCGYKIPFPSNCILCPFMSLQELLYLFRYDRDNFDLWVLLESNKIQNNLHKGDKNLGVWGTTKLLPEMIEIAIEKYGHMTKEELIEYKMSHGHCVKSKY